MRPSAQDENFFASFFFLRKKEVGCRAKRQRLSILSKRTTKVGTSIHCYAALSHRLFRTPHIAQSPTVQIGGSPSTMLRDHGKPTHHKRRHIRLRSVTAGRKPPTIRATRGGQRFKQRGVEARRCTEALEVGTPQKTQLHERQIQDIR